MLRRRVGVGDEGVVEEAEEGVVRREAEADEEEGAVAEEHQGMRRRRRRRRSACEEEAAAAVMDSGCGEEAYVRGVRVGGRGPKGHGFPTFSWSKRQAKPGPIFQQIRNYFLKIQETQFKMHGCIY
jgi:hypothetical protein